MEGGVKMIIFTITKWRRKIIAFLIAVVFIAGLGWGVNWFFFSPDENATIAPSGEQTGKLEDDIRTQPVKVQGQPGEVKEDNAK